MLHVFVGLRFDRGKTAPPRTASPGIVDQDIDLAELPDGVLDHGTHLRLVAHIGLPENCIDAKVAPQRIGRGAPSVLIVLGNQHIGTFRRQSAGNPLTDTRTGTGNDGRALIKSPHDCPHKIRNPARHRNRRSGRVQVYRVRGSPRPRSAMMLSWISFVPA